MTRTLCPGTNTVEVDVANSWMNRLVAEAAAPTGEIFAPVAGICEPDAPVQRCGLPGPVRRCGLPGPVRLQFLLGPGAGS